jgi:hypothetical protein
MPKHRPIEPKKKVFGKAEFGCAQVGLGRLRRPTKTYVLFAVEKTTSIV